VTDLLGNILVVVVHAANLHDTTQGGEVFQKALSEYSSLWGVRAETGYRKTFENAVKSLGLKVEISERIKHEFKDTAQALAYRANIFMAEQLQKIIQGL
jgi:hypothetical protein